MSDVIEIDYQPDAPTAQPSFQTVQFTQTLPIGIRPTRRAETVDISTLGKGQGRLSDRERLERCRSVYSYGIPSASVLRERYSGKIIIAGGGPSIKDTVKDIRRQLKLSKRTKIVAVNKTHDWLISLGIKPDFGVMIDPKPWVAEYMTPTKGVTYLLGAKCDPKVFERFKGHPNVYHWHPIETVEELDTLRHRSDYLAVPGQSTVGLRCDPLFYELGFRDMEFHGLDCSKVGKNGHAYEKITPATDMRDVDITLDFNDKRRKYVGTDHMARQLGEFKAMLEMYDEMEKSGMRQPTNIRVAGDGALPFWAAVSYGIHVNETYNENPALMPGPEIESYDALDRIVSSMSFPVPWKVLEARKRAMAG